MLTKALHIKNVGRFNTTGAVELAQGTVLYAENGRGKTTLAAILRSLQTGEPLHVLERHTLGATDAPSIAVLTTTGSKNSTCTFDGQVWSATLSNCEIFDATFVAENVYSGSQVDPDHRRRLHNFVLGASNVALARRVDELDDEIRGATQKIANAESALLGVTADGMPLDVFVKLAAITDVDDAIRAQESVVEMARASDVINETRSLTSIQAPEIESTVWDRTLAVSLEGVEHAAEALIREHIATNRSDLTEAWLSEGLGYTNGVTCPMCAGDITNSKLIRAYRTCFSEAYKQLKEEIDTARKGMLRELAPSICAAIVAGIEANADLAPFWKAHGVTTPDTLDIANLETALASLRAAYSRAFEAKVANPLEPITIADLPADVIADLADARNAIAEYNLAVEKANAAIANVKATAAANSLSAAIDRLRILRNCRIRHSAAGSAAVDGLQAERAAKKKLEGDKKTAKDALDTATLSLFTDYQKLINQHLSNCGCGYTITGTKTVYTGGKSRTEYQLVINSKVVDLAGPKAGIAASFKNTLSDGDKSTLAFAFFLARLELDPKLSDKIVVLDDPMTSLDAHRRVYTCTCIAALAPKCRQLILLTHDAQFAKQVWDRLSKPKRALQIEEHAGQSRITEWDIVAATESEYFARYRILSAFMEKSAGDRTAVAASLRPFLEGNLRMRFPGQFSPDEWLGDFIKKVKAASSTDILGGLQSNLNELTDLNDYSKQFHHDQNPNASQVKPVDAELRAYTGRALAFAAGLP